MYILALLRWGISLNMAYNISLDISIPAFPTPQAYYRTDFVNFRWERHLSGCLIRPNANVSNSHQAWLFKKRSAIPIQTILNDKPLRTHGDIFRKYAIAVFLIGILKVGKLHSALLTFHCCHRCAVKQLWTTLHEGLLWQKRCIFWYWYHQFYSSSLILFPGKNNWVAKKCKIKAFQIAVIE